MRVEFFRHALGPEEVGAVVETLQGLILTTGAANRDFEADLAGYLGVPDAVTTTSCTAALHLSLTALGIGSGDEVITTPLSYVASANSILMAGARPVFVDVDSATGLIDVAAVEAAISDRTRAVLPVHLYGRMVDMRRLRDSARQHGLAIVEDAAHALDAVRDGVRPGQLGDCACFSFYATKSITCGEGGAAVTSDARVAERLRRLRNLGIDQSPASRHGAAYRHWDMVELGWRYSLTNFQAAMLRPQLRRVEERRTRREAIARAYAAAFARAGISCPAMPEAGERSGHYLFTIWVEPERRDAVIAGLQQAGIGIAVNYRPIHLMRYYVERFGFRPGAFPNAECIGARTISIPCYASLTDAEVEYVMDVVCSVVAGQRIPAVASLP